MPALVASLMHNYVLHPWRHLDDWNKPSNVDQPSFDDICSLAITRTDFARERRIVLRGKTTEMIVEISDESLDFAYIDGDHRRTAAAMATARATYALWRFVLAGLWRTRGTGFAGFSFLDHPPLLNRLPHGTKRDEVLLVVRVHRRVCFSDLDCGAWRAPLKPSRFEVESVD